MLKLERKRKSSDVHVRLREREPHFNRLLCKALMIAVGIHLGALLLFHVHPFIMQPSFIHAPIQVQFDRPSGSQVFSDPVELDESLYSLTPPLELLFDNLNFEARQPIAFLDISQELSIHYTPPALTMPLMMDAIQLHISGDLAQRPLLKCPKELEQQVPFNPQKPDPRYVTYHVRLDELTGKIFWHDRIRSSKDEKMDQLMEKILFDLEFEMGKPFENDVGTIDFVVYL